MKKSEYLKLIEYAKNPYLGFLDEKGIKSSEVVNLAAFCDEKSAAALDENFNSDLKKLDEMGYCIYFEDGLADKRFLSEAIGLLGDNKIDMLYFDEDFDYKEPFFKPDFSPNTLESFFYIGGLVIVRNDLVHEGEPVVRRLNPDVYSLIAERIIYKFENNGFSALHIPKVYFHSSKKNSYEYPEAVSLFPMPGEVEKNIEETLDYISENKISVIILSKDNPKLALCCIDSLLKWSDLTMEYILVDNGSNNHNKSVYEAELAKRNVKYIYHPMEFVYSAMCNIGAREAKGEFLLFLNDDVLVPENTAGFPSGLLELAKRKSAGAVGIRLLYPKSDVYEKCGISLDDETKTFHEILRIQHVGMTQLASGPSHRLATYPDDTVYEYGRNRRVWNVMGVTGACLLVNKKKFESVGGFDERIKIAYTDTDLCLDLLDKGYINVVNNDIYLYHLESVTRGDDVKDDSKLKRLNDEREILYSKHPWLINSGDSYSNPSLSKESLEYKPDYKLPWEHMYIVSDFKALGKNERVLTVTKDCSESKLMGCIDSVSLIRDNNENYYEITGWSILHGKNQLAFEKMVAIKIHDEIRLFPAKFMYRPELADVFPKEKKQQLSGFVSKIKAELFEGNDINTIDFGIALKKKSYFKTDEYYYRMI